jgi:hypothetical protein
MNQKYYKPIINIQPSFSILEKKIQKKIVKYIKNNQR